MKLDIPGWGPIHLEHLVLDFNGTIAKDGALLPGVAERVRRLAESGMDIWVITADTNGGARKQCAGLPLQMRLPQCEDVARHKAALVQELGAQTTAAIGNGRNDRQMLEAAALSIAVVGGEGCFTGTALAAALLVTDIRDGLDLLLCGHRLKASLRG